MRVLFSVLALTLGAAASSLCHAYTRTEAEDLARRGLPAGTVRLLALRGFRLAPLALAAERARLPERLTQLASRESVPAAAGGARLGAGEDACGPARLLQEVLLRPARITRPALAWLYDPAAAEYELGGLLLPGTGAEALALRKDGFVALMVAGQRVVLVRRAALAETPLPPARRPAPAAAATPSPWTAICPGVTYAALKAPGTLLHVLQGDLRTVRLSAALSPFYDGLAPGPQRTLPVRELARRGAAAAAINGTFFVSNSGHPRYGLPFGSFVLGGRLAWELTEQYVLDKRRCYVAGLEDGRAVLGDTQLRGREILERNARGQFDPARLGEGRLRSFSSGYGWLVEQGDRSAWRRWAGVQFDPSYYSATSRVARSLLGLDASGSRCWLIAVEASDRSPAPLTHPELADYLPGVLPIRDLVFLDGGGSTELLAGGRGLNLPSDGSPRRNSSVLTFVSPPARS